MKQSPFFKQAQAMLKILPYVAKEECFALKGGTAINLFWRDMPRLSVDIDLAYLPIQSREISQQAIHDAMKRIAIEIRAQLPKSKVQESLVYGTKRISKLFIQLDGVQVKVEPNDVIRGVIYPCIEKSLVQTAEDIFELSVSVNTVALADLFGRKICAALDRQHPRDLFDVKLLLENEGISEEIRKAFLVYLMSHDRPIHELLNPIELDVKSIFENEFLGMTAYPVSYADLCEARQSLIVQLNKDLTLSERQFLLTFKEGNPEWNLLGIANVDNLPAVHWKLMNIKKMEKKKHAASVERLKKVLGV